MAFAKFQVNQFRIDGEIAENHAIPVNLTASRSIVAVNFHQRWVFFADLSVNSESIFMKFCKHSFKLFRRLP